MARGERRLRGGVQTPLKYVFDFTLCSRGKSHLWCAEKQTRKNTKLQKVICKEIQKEDVSSGKTEKK